MKEYTALHYSDVIMGAMASQIVASRLLTQPFIRAQIKENIKALRHWPLCAEVTGDRWIPRINGQWRGKCFHFMTSSWTVLVWYSVRTFPTQIARFTWPTWGPPGSCRPQLGPMLAPWTLLSGHYLSEKLISVSLESSCYNVEILGVFATIVLVSIASPVRMLCDFSWNGSSCWWIC